MVVSNVREGLEKVRRQGERMWVVRWWQEKRRALIWHILGECEAGSTRIGRKEAGRKRSEGRNASRWRKGV